MKTISLLALTSLLITSCGPSAAELARIEKRKNDSIAEAAVAEAQEKERLKTELIQPQGELAAAKTRLSSIEEFHVLRTDAEKAAQVGEQTKVILSLEEKIAELQSKLNS